MSSEDVRPKKKNTKLAELYRTNGFTGEYLRKIKSTYSFIYWFKCTDGVERGVFGNKSLDKYLVDDFLGLTLKIECCELKDIGRENPFAIAKVSYFNGNHFENIKLIKTVDMNHPSIPKPMFLEDFNKKEYSSEDGPENPFYEQPGIEDQPIVDMRDWEAPEYPTED